MVSDCKKKMATLLPPPLQIKNEEGTATEWKNLNFRGITMSWLLE